MDFKEKVKSMSAKEIILAMVESLIPPPAIKIDMETYGRVDTKTIFGIPIPFTRICYGCAATNTICKIAGKKFDASNIESSYDKAKLINSDVQFLTVFEKAIDALRRGDIYLYNKLARDHGFAAIKENYDTVLKYLDNNYTKADLDGYIQLANIQENK